MPLMDPSDMIVILENVIACLAGRETCVTVVLFAQATVLAMDPASAMELVPVTLIGEAVPIAAV